MMKVTQGCLASWLLKTEATLRRGSYCWAWCDRKIEMRLRRWVEVDGWGW